VTCFAHSKLQHGKKRNLESQEKETARSPSRRLYLSDADAPICN
jgi:hypothetical protein